MLIKSDVLEVKDVKEVYPTAIGIACDGCAIEYSLKDYQILKDNKKLIYFLHIPKGKDDALIFCHDCFFKYIKKISQGEKELELLVYTKDEIIKLMFTPQEMLPEDYDDEGNDDYLGLF